MNLGQFLLLIVVLGAIVAFVGVPYWMARRREGPQWNASRFYLAAIDALIRGDRPGAVGPLRELARHESENLGVYLRLGDLVRHMGHPDRAQKVHADLLARNVTNPEDLRRAHESLLEDLMLLDRPEEAKRAAEQLLALDRKNPVGLRAMVHYHEWRGEWEQALELLDEWEKVTPGETRPTPVQMRVHMARLHIEGARPREARKLLEETVKMVPDGALARVFLGDLLVTEGDVEKACEQWIQYVQDNGVRPEQVFARLEKAYFEMGRFGDLVQVYENLAAGRPGNLHAAVALADMHRRRGRLEEAVRQLESVLEQQPHGRYARRQLIGSLSQLGRTEQALREFDILLSELLPDETGAICPQCGAHSPELWVRCERCGAWQEPARAVPPPRPRSVPVPHAD